MLYFAFGSNMDPQQLRNRVGEVPSPRNAQLREYKLVFDKYSRSRKCGAANVFFTGKNEDFVEGLLYSLTEAQFKILDEFEGTESKNIDTYKRVEIDLACGTRAFTYIAQGELVLKGATELKPNITYLQHLYAGKPYLSNSYYQQLLSVTVVNEQQAYLNHCVRFGLQIGAIKALMEEGTRIEDWMVRKMEDPKYQQNKPKTYETLKVIVQIYQNFKNEFKDLSPEETQKAFQEQIEAGNWSKALALIALGGKLEVTTLTRLIKLHDHSPEFISVFKPFIVYAVKPNSKSTSLRFNAISGTEIHAKY